MKVSKQLSRVFSGRERPLLRLLVLTTLKEAYLFLRNTYGLLVHPFKTIFAIRQKPDWSQTILVFGWPVGGFFGVFGAFIFGLIFVIFLWPTNEALVNLCFLFLTVGCFLFTVCFGYLGFCLGQYFLRYKSKRRDYQFKL